MEDNETGEVVSQCLGYTAYFVLHNTDFILYKIGLRLLQFFVLCCFFKAEKCDLVSIFDDGGFWTKGEFQGGNLRVRETIFRWLL